MTTAKGSVLAMAAFGLGVWVGPHLTGPAAPAEAPRAAIVIPAPIEPAPVAPVRTPSVPRAKRTAVAPTSVDLHARLKPVLNRGTNMDIAAEGFRDGEQFATIAHAARNTEVPFLLLKHRVLSEGKSLAAAIRDSKPAIDASVQADLAAAQARADIATIKG
jgi:hypothetical protein